MRLILYRNISGGGKSTVCFLAFILRISDSPLESGLHLQIQTGIPTIKDEKPQFPVLQDLGSKPDE